MISGFDAMSEPEIFLEGGEWWMEGGSAEELGVGAEADEVDDVGGFVAPDEEIVGADVAFQTAAVLARQCVGPHFGRDRLAGGKLEKHGVKFFYETRAVAEALEVFFELAGEA